MNFWREMEGSALKCAFCSNGYDEGSQLLRCSRCKLVFYCSKECAPAPPTKRVCALLAGWHLDAFLPGWLCRCQQAAWKAGHKADCRELSIAEAGARFEAANNASDWKVSPPPAPPVLTSKSRPLSRPPTPEHAQGA